jgi:uncharacterized protein
MLGWSVFNHKCKRDDSYRIYNTLTKGIIDIECESYDYLQKCFNSKDLNDDVKEAIVSLIDQGYISNFEDQWGDFYVNQKKDYKNLTGSMMLYYIPSWMCDFRCTYCHYYNNIQNQSFDSDEQIRQSAIYAAKYINLLYCKFNEPITITVVLYGGEPLLSLEKHLLFLSTLQEQKASENTTYSVVVITNGFNLSEENIKSLVKFNVKGMQITVDGEPEIHNKRRIHENGGETFTTIIENTKTACMIYSIPITLRINVDENNIHSVPSLLKNIRDYGIKKNLILSISPVFSNVNVQGAVFNKSVLTGFRNIYKAAAEFNYPFVFPTTACSYFSSEFLVIANNKAYSCPSMSASDMDAICSINDTPIVNNKPLELSKKCKQCKWVPLCGGGCTYQNIKDNSIQCMALTYKLLVEAYMEEYSKINRLIKG